MTNLITKSDFKNPYQVYSGTTETELLLDEYITKYQEYYLKKILGIRMYNDFDSKYPDGGFYDNFVNGTTYTEDSVSYVYPGIKPVLVKFVYYWWHRNTATILGEKGELKANYQKLVKTIPVNKMVSAYNDAVDLIDNNISYDATVYHYLNTQYTGTDWDFTRINKINAFNI